MSTTAAPLRTATAEVLAEAARTAGQGVRSKDAANVADLLLRAPIPPRRAAVKTLSARELGFVVREVRREQGTLYGLWHDSPSGFVEDVLGETIWSKQRDVLDAVASYKRTAVPAGFGVGKTWLAGRLVAWMGCVNPPGTAVIVTTATRFRQVRNQLWPHIRKTVARAALPGWCDTTQWKIPDVWGNAVVVAYGFTAPENDEAAMQGIHGTPKLLIVVDEAGGIARTIGNGTNNLLTGDSRMLAIGNPPADDPARGSSSSATKATTPKNPPPQRSRSASSTHRPSPWSASPTAGTAHPAARPTPRRAPPQHGLG
ncbi:hypothetical protein ACFQ0M_47915 [Kitasatospora aburaviensis]